MKKLFLKLKAKLAENKAEAYIQTLIAIFIFMLVLISGLAIIPVMIQKIQVDFAADEIARYVSLAGDLNVTEASLSNVINNYGIEFDDITVSADVPEAAGETRIQLSDGFTVTVVKPVTVSLGGFYRGFTVDVTSVARGRSEVYWKSLDRP